MKEFRGYHEEGHVLQIGIEIEAVAGDVVGIVVPLPPSDADPGQTVPGQDLGYSVEPFRGHDLVVARIVAQPSTLNPDKSHQSTA